MADDNTARPRPRVVSLLPSATEIVCCVGAGPPQLVGVSHECDWPASVRSLPALTAARTDPNATSQEIHDAVVAALRPAGNNGNGGGGGGDGGANGDGGGGDKQQSQQQQQQQQQQQKGEEKEKEGQDWGAGGGLYSVDAAQVAALAPDVIVTQSLCEVCSVDVRLVERLCGALTPRPRIVALNPFSLEEVFQDCITVGHALGRAAEAEAAVASLKARVAAVKAYVAARAPVKLPNVGWLEWTEPIFCAGHWTPQLIAMAGGAHPLNPATPESGAKASRAVTNEEFAASDPDWVVVAPCGFGIGRAKTELARIAGAAWWGGLRAVREGRVVIVDGNQMFNRPGPRLVDGLEFLAALLHGDEGAIPAGFPYEWWRP